MARASTRQLGDAFTAVLNAAKALAEISECCFPADCPRSGSARLRWACDILDKDWPALILALQSRPYSVYSLLDPKLLADRDFVITAARRKGLVLRYAAAQLKCDREVALAAVEQAGCALQWADSFADDDELVLAAVRNNGIALRFASKRLASDRDVVLVAVRCNGEALEYTAEALRRDKQVVLEAVRQSGHAVRFAGDALIRDHDVALEAARQNGDALQHLPIIARSRDVVLAAVRSCGDALYFADAALKSDLEIVKAAVAQNGNALRFAADELKASQEVVLAATRKSSQALRWATRELLTEYGFCLQAARINGLTLPRLAFSSDFAVASAAIQQNPDALMHAPEALRFNREVVLRATKVKWQAAQYAAEELQRDPEVLAAIVAQLPEATESDPRRVEVRLLSGETCGSLEIVGEKACNVSSAIERAFGIDPLLQNLIVEGCSAVAELQSDILYPHVGLEALEHGRRNGQAKRLPALIVALSSREPPRYW